MARVVYRHREVMSTQESLEAFIMRQIKINEERRTIKGEVRSPPLRLSINLDTMLRAREIKIQISARNDPGEGVEYGVESRRIGGKKSYKCHYVNFLYGVEDNGIFIPPLLQGKWDKTEKNGCLSDEVW